VKRIAESSVRRLSLYLRYLEDFERLGRATISSDELAQCGGTTSSQVRKDLSLFGSFGKRGLGYAVPDLATRLRAILGVGREWRVIIVGAGKIGAALAQYRGFRQRGFKLVGLFDVDPERIGQKWAGVTVRDMERFERDSRSLRPHIAVVTVPADAAQAVIDRVSKAGIKAVLNFAPAGVSVRDDVTVRNVNMALELEVLSYALIHGA
jgi:redox-sensing transcriptional repressor